VDAPPLREPILALWQLGRRIRNVTISQTTTNCDGRHSYPFPILESYSHEGQFIIEPSTSTCPASTPVPIPIPSAGEGFFFRVQLPASKQLGNNMPAIERNRGVSGSPSFFALYPTHVVA